jgi:hypothetical protein
MSVARDFKKSAGRGYRQRGWGLTAVCKKRNWKGRGVAVLGSSDAGDLVYFQPLSNTLFVIFVILQISNLLKMH